MQTLLLEQRDDRTLASVRTLDESRLPEGDVTVDVHWSSLNYKDTLAITGRGKIIRNFPMISGIDFAGAVHTNENPRFHAGQEILLTGWGVDENHWGGLVEQMRVEGNQLAVMPQELDTRKAVTIGTAGFTAMLCVMALEDVGIRPQDREIVAMGTSSGADSTAVALLHRLGYQVVAVSGHESTRKYLESSGVSRIPPRDEPAGSRPLERQVWAGTVDTISDKVPAKVLAQMDYGDCAAVCGLAGGFILPTTVMPFILYNVRLQGVGSAITPPEHRTQARQRLVADLPESFYIQTTKGVSLLEVPNFAEAIINNQVQGRTLVKAS